MHFYSQPPPTTDWSRRDWRQRMDEAMACEKEVQILGEWIIILIPPSTSPPPPHRHPSGCGLFLERNVCPNWEYGQAAVRGMHRTNRMRHVEQNYLSKKGGLGLEDEEEEEHWHRGWISIFRDYFVLSSSPKVVLGVPCTQLNHLGNQSTSYFHQIQLIKCRLEFLELFLRRSFLICPTFVLSSSHRRLLSLWHLFSDSLSGCLFSDLSFLHSNPRVIHLNFLNRIQCICTWHSAQTVRKDRRTTCTERSILAASLSHTQWTTRRPTSKEDHLTTTMPVNQVSRDSRVSPEREKRGRVHVEGEI